MPKYMKRIQVLLTLEQFKNLDDIATQRNKKIGTLVREAIVEYHLKQSRQRRVAEAVDRLFTLPELPVPEDYQEWEEEYLKGKYPRS